MSWEHELATALDVRIATVDEVTGGEINDCYRVQLVDRRTVFVKTHHAPPPGMYVAEAAGLEWLRAGPLRVPDVVAAGESFLALEWLEVGARGRDFTIELGRGLAHLHRLGARCFGHDRDNFLATLAQHNQPAVDVVELWIERRLRPLVTRLGARVLDRKLDLLATRRDRFGPPEPPARLHGDLWWGNVMCGGGTPILIDPAVYGGHREIDLAMLALFGNLPDTLIDAYSELAPLAEGWRDRLPLWQLYPLAAHAVLFGGGYAAQLDCTFDAFI